MTDNKIKTQCEDIAVDFAEWCRTHAVSGNDGFWHLPINSDLLIFKVISSRDLYKYYLSLKNKT